jgi:cell division protein FtsQ
LSSTAPPPPAPPRADPPIDPRIRARRIEVARGRGRRRLRRLGWVAGAAVALALAWALAFSPVLDVDGVEVEGAARSGDEAVAAASGIESGQAMVSLDLGAAASGVDDLAWVAEARIRRRWPGTVRIEVEERRPVAVVAVERGDPEAGWMLVDAAGHQLEVVHDPAPGVPHVFGVGAATRPGALLGAAAAGPLRLAAIAPDQLASALEAVAVDDEGDLRARVALPGGAATVLLGPAQGLEAKLLALEAVLSGADLAGVRVIDVRVPTSPALTRGTGED